MDQWFIWPCHQFSYHNAFFGLLRNFVWGMNTCNLISFFRLVPNSLSLIVIEYFLVVIVTWYYKTNHKWKRYGNMELVKFFFKAHLWLYLDTYFGYQVCVCGKYLWPWWMGNDIEKYTLEISIYIIFYSTSFTWGSA